MRKLLEAAVAVTFLALSTPTARAWWDMGHMTVAAVAYERLTPAARARAAALLRLNPKFDNWTRGVPPEEQDRAAFVHAATWADDIKRSRDYRRSSIAQDGADAVANIGYADHLAHDYWHYVDLPYSPDGTPGEPPQAPNALTQIEAFRRTLASDASDDVKSYDLVWLLHLVGDVHQPLHATSRFSRGLPNGDRGGNTETVCLAFTCGAKLHAYWDGLLGDRGSPSDAEALAATLPSPDATAAAVDDPATWVKESERLAEQFVYAGPIGDGAGPFALTDAYQADAKRVAEQQVALAGARLSQLLDRALR
ncbi:MULTISPECIES: S1/P1 nuclease [Methylosinus]|uniref:S1/P1 nuclease n=1 Tax=Methylosinus trichosporium (strain ATCC 35070 / NCIMB 11131 / UNIQEM 75 / OB3b) TaxID=595536 RepID=A0A2D2CYL7_METT3|nr:MULTISPECIES: S1/P1 nuclease [Methylosinus]ATQ67840.1 S1/P1 nuclease [Methylosinus trichosporium OB3b]OBS51859.1 S1/P1 nuclease [Methylosinus sp. 3S-1]